LGVSWRFHLDVCGWLIRKIIMATDFGADIARLLGERETSELREQFIAVLAMIRAIRWRRSRREPSF